MIFVSPSLSSNVGLFVVCVYLPFLEKPILGFSVFGSSKIFVDLLNVSFAKVEIYRCIF